jgi:hypothetical protein
MEMLSFGSLCLSLIPYPNYQSRMPSLVSTINSMGHIEISVYTSSMLNLWLEQNLPGLNCAKAFALIKYGNIKNSPHYKALMEAMLRLYKQQHHSKETPYNTLSEYKRTYALQALDSALNQFPMDDEEWLALIPTTDRLKGRIMERYRRSIGSRRDPEGSIDLEAFANDSQSVHRAPVQNAINEGLRVLMASPLPEGLDSFNEIMREFTSRGQFREKYTMLYTFACDMDTLSVSLNDSTYKYIDVVNHLWAKIRNHSQKEELFKRLSEEMEEGYQYCANGKIARLINVLVGFEEGFVIPLDPREVFQNKIAELIPLPLEERTSRAMQMFRDYSIREDEQGAWLEALKSA